MKVTIDRIVEGLIQAWAAVELPCGEMVDVPAKLFPCGHDGAQYTITRWTPEVAVHPTQPICTAGQNGNQDNPGNGQNVNQGRPNG